MALIFLKFAFPVASGKPLGVATSCKTAHGFLGLTNCRINDCA